MAIIIDLQATIQYTSRKITTFWELISPRYTFPSTWNIRVQNIASIAFTLDKRDSNLNSSTSALCDVSAIFVLSVCQMRKAQNLYPSMGSLGNGDCDVISTKRWWDKSIDKSVLCEFPLGPWEGWQFITGSWPTFYCPVVNW